MHSIRSFTILVAAGLVPVAAAPAAAQLARGVTGETRPVPTARIVADDAPFWGSLNDSTLNRLMEQALSGNRELRAAGARVDGAGAARTQAALQLVPNLNASAGYTRRRFASSTFPGSGGASLPDQGVWDSGLNAAWEVDVFGRLRNGLRAENALLESADESVRDARVAVAARVARAYLDLRAAQEQLAVAKRNAANQLRTLELTRTRLDAGRGTAFDTERARAQYSTTLAAIPAIEESVAALQYRIGVLVGRPPADIAVELADDEGGVPDLPEAPPAPDASEVIRARPDVMAAERRVAAGRALVSSARADYLPRISVVGGAGYIANAVDSFGGTGTFNYTVGPVISWAAFDLGRVKARVDAAQAQQLEARAQYEQAMLVAGEQLAAATTAYRTTRDRLAHLREAAEASERAASLARLRYEGGIADFLQVLDAERTLLAAQDQLVQGEARAADAWVALFEARGVAWRQDPRDGP